MGLYCINCSLAFIESKLAYYHYNTSTDSVRLSDTGFFTDPSTSVHSHNRFCRYETGNGIMAEERGVMLNKGTETEANSVTGSYRYVSPEGVPIEVTYTAGVDGFRAYGTHLPVAPAAASNVPKSLAYKNVVPTAFARPPQFRSIAESRAVDAGVSQSGESPVQVPGPAPEALGTAADTTHVVLSSHTEPSTDKPAEIVKPPAAVVNDDAPRFSPPSPSSLSHYPNNFVRSGPDPSQQQAVARDLSPVSPGPLPAEPFDPSKAVAHLIQAAQQTGPLSSRPRDQLPVIHGLYSPPRQRQHDTRNQYHYDPRPQVQQPFPAYNPQPSAAGLVRQFSVEPQQMRYLPQGRYYNQYVPRSQWTPSEPPKY